MEMNGTGPDPHFLFRASPVDAQPRQLCEILTCANTPRARPDGGSFSQFAEEVPVASEFILVRTSQRQVCKTTEEVPLLSNRTVVASALLSCADSAFAVVTVQSTRHRLLSLVEPCVSTDSLAQADILGFEMSVPSRFTVQRATWRLKTLELDSARNCTRRIISEVSAKKNVVKSATTRNTKSMR